METQFKLQNALDYAYYLNLAWPSVEEGGMEREGEINTHTLM